MKPLIIGSDINVAKTPSRIAPIIILKKKTKQNKTKKQKQEGIAVSNFLEISMRPQKDKDDIKNKFNWKPYRYFRLNCPSVAITKDVTCFL